jgi:DNA-binding transcriptional MerR regulator
MRGAKGERGEAALLYLGPRQDSVWNLRYASGLGAASRTTVMEGRRGEAPLFRQPEVCDIAKVQPYVLRSWEAEFPDLGVAKTEGGQRVYRRADVERVLRLKHLLYVEGLTLAGARRRLSEEQPATADPTALSEVADLFGADARERILQVRRGLRELSAMLAKTPSASAAPEEFELKVAPVPKPRRKK